MKSISFSPLEKGYYNSLVKDYITQTENTKVLYNNYFDKADLRKLFLKENSQKKVVIYWWSN